MRLITVDYARKALGELDYDDINQRLDTAINLVTHPMESYLKTKFLKGSYTDLFHITNLPSTKSQDMTLLLLSRGLLDGDVDIEIKVETTYSALADGITTGESYFIDNDKGLITFPERLPTVWVQVTYTAGIDGDDEEYDEDSVPFWLKDSTLVYVSSVYQRLIAAKNRDKEKALAQKPGSIVEIPPEMFPMIAQYVRWNPTAYSPEMTT